MALKGDRKVVEDDITGLLFSEAEAGSLVIYKASQPSGSGLGPGLGTNATILDIIPITGPASGARIYGVLMNDFVDVDETKNHKNFLRGDQMLGEPAYVLKKGWIVTNRVSGTPAAGAPAYATISGYFGASQINSVPAVGEFVTAKDADGYARINVNLP